MTTQTLARAIKRKMPAIIKEKGAPRYVVLDWDMYKRFQEWQEQQQEELEDYLEVNDPIVQEHIREGMKEYMAGKSRPMEEFLAELDLVRDKPRKSRRIKKRR